ncbi:hypothetical protein AWB76_04944 [Caballeronia temeraria]|uniref:Uncharacterized protein n=1 Tax=Caballeronia temeraria TaxID=1777137 RepID=A0A158BZV5_9BURK|nr:hypothetical protein [Caballeronia temeraria]SAK75645.1 hypothetical protein AWB76_04944 [Caballeronia temeraria]
MTRVRERNLDDTIVALIVEVLDGWSGRLSWEALIEAIARRAGLSYTRQTLHRHERIRLAFAVRKKALSGQIEQPREWLPPELQVALDRIARLEAENQRLLAENHNLLEQFARWASTRRPGTSPRSSSMNRFPAWTVSRAGVLVRLASRVLNR